jgi:hypothetical protein
MAEATRGVAVSVALLAVTNSPHPDAAHAEAAPWWRRKYAEALTGLSIVTITDFAVGFVAGHKGCCAP